MDKTVNPRRLIASGIVLGIGLGGFVDGILFHQILQLHSMLSNRLPRTSIVNLEVNMFWDGIFHAFTWLMTVLGLGMLWQAGKNRSIPWSTRTFIGSLLTGWGLFNLVEGLLDHQIFQLHHVIQTTQNHWVGDSLFLLSGVILIIAGRQMIRSDRPNREALTFGQDQAA